MTVTRRWPALVLVPMLVAGCAAAGSAPRPATSAATPAPSGIVDAPTGATGAMIGGIGRFAFAPDGSLYTSACDSNVVVRLTSPTDGVPVVDGSGTSSSDFGDRGPALSASVVCPTGLAFDAQGRLLIADHGHNRVRRVEADGTITTIVGAKSPPYVNRGAFSGDGGPAVDAALDAPVGLTMAANGTLYVADRENDRVRDVTADGIIHTLAGNGFSEFGATGGDGGPATQATLDFPLSTVVDRAGNVYIADDNHNRIRRVAADGTISTVIGDGTFASGGDGGPATKAQVNDPQGVAIDAGGDLYVSEYGANRIRRIDPSGIVQTVAGTGGTSASAIGGQALMGDVPQPGQLGIGPDGALYVEDQDYGRILRIDLSTGVLSVAAGGEQGVRMTP